MLAIFLAGLGGLGGLGGLDILVGAVVLAAHLHVGAVLLADGRSALAHHDTRGQASSNSHRSSSISTVGVCVVRKTICCTSSVRPMVRNGGCYVELLCVAVECCLSCC